MDTGVNGRQSDAVVRRHPSGRPTIGLLAGMGVRSTGPFLDFVIEECQAQLRRPARGRLSAHGRVLVAHPLLLTDLNYLVEGESSLPLVDGGQELAARVVAHWRSLMEAGTEKAVER